MFRLIVPAMRLDNRQLLDLYLSVLPQERWLDLDGNGNSFAHYAAAYGVVAEESKLLTEALKNESVNQRGYTPNQIINKKVGLSINFAELGLLPSEATSLMDMAMNSLNSSDNLQKMFYKNIHAIATSGQMTKGQLDILKMIFEKISDQSIKAEAFNIIVRMMMLSGDYQATKIFYLGNAFVSNINQHELMLLALDMLIQSRAIMAEKQKHMLSQFLPADADNLTVALIILSVVNFRDIQSVGFGKVQLYLTAAEDAIIQLVGSYKDGATTKSNLVDMIANLAMFENIFTLTESNYISTALIKNTFFDDDIALFSNYHGVRQRCVELQQLIEDEIFVDDYYLTLRTRKLSERKLYLDGYDKALEKLKKHAAKAKESAVGFRLHDPNVETVVLPKVDWQRFDDFNQNTMLSYAYRWAVENSESGFMVLFRPMDYKEFVIGNGGMSYLHLAAAEGSRDGLRRLLIELKNNELINPFLKELFVRADRKGRTPLDHAILSGNKPLVSYLISNRYGSFSSGFHQLAWKGELPGSVTRANLLSRDSAGVSAIEYIVSGGHLQLLQDAFALVKEGDIDPLALLQRALEAKQIDLLSFILSKINESTFISNQKDIVKCIRRRFRDDIGEVVDVFAAFFNQAHQSNRVARQFFLAAAELEYRDILFGLLDRYQCDQQEKQLIVGEICHEIKIVGKVSAEQRMLFVSEVLTHYYDQLSYMSLMNDLVKDDKLHPGDFKLESVGLLVFYQKTNHMQLQPGLRSQAAFAAELEACLAGGEIDCAKVLSIIHADIKVVSPQKAIELSCSLMDKLKYSLIIASKKNKSDAVIRKLLSMVYLLFASKTITFTDGDALIFSNFAFAVDMYRLAFKLLPVDADNRLGRLANQAKRIILAYYSELKIQQDKNVREFYISRISNLCSHQFITEVATGFSLSELKLSSLDQLMDDLSYIQDQINRIKADYSKKKKGPVSNEKDETHLYEVLYRFSGFLRTFKVQIVDNHPEEKIKTYDLLKLNELRAACNMALRSIDAFKSIVQQFITSCDSRRLMRLDMSKLMVDDLLKSFKDFGNLVSISIVPWLDIEDKPKQNNRKAVISNHEASVINVEKKKEEEIKREEIRKREEEEERADELLRIELSVPLKPIIMPPTWKPTVKWPKPAPQKSTRPVASSSSSSIEMSKSLPLIKTVSVAPRPELVAEPAAKISMTPSIAVSPPTMVLPVQTRLPFFSQPLAVMQIEPRFNKIPPAIFELLRLLDSIPTQKQFQPFVGVATPRINVLIVGGTVRDCYLLDVLNGDIDLWVSLTDDQVLQAFPQAKMQGKNVGKRCYTISWFGYDVDLIPVDPDKLDEKFAECDFTINQCGYHPLLPRLVASQRTIRAIETRYLDHVNDGQNIFTQDPVRLLRSIRFEVRYDLKTSDRIENEIALLRATDRIEDLIRFIKESKLHSEYKKLLLACEGDEAFAKSRLERRGIYNVLVDLEIVQPVQASSPKI